MYVIQRNFPFIHIYFSRFDYFDISPPIISLLKKQGHFRVQFTWYFPLKYEIYQKDTCELYYDVNHAEPSQKRLGNDYDRGPERTESVRLWF